MESLPESHLWNTSTGTLAHIPQHGDRQGSRNWHKKDLRTHRYFKHIYIHTKGVLWKQREEKHHTTSGKCAGIFIPHLFDLQTVAPYPFQEVTQTGYQGVLFHSCDIHLTMTKLHSFSTHLLHQHPLSLKKDKAKERSVSPRNSQDHLYFLNNQQGSTW